MKFVWYPVQHMSLESPLIHYTKNQLSHKYFWKGLLGAGGFCVLFLFF